MAIDVGKFIKAPEYDITIITYRDVFQTCACEADRVNEECVELSAMVVLDASEMKRMGIQDNSNVRLVSQCGSVVVTAKASPRQEQKGTGFMVNSPWSNSLVSVETPDGIPEYKNINAKITVSKEDITSIQEIFE
jgi:formylmethanofuran dehydrogenase subunit D